MRFGVALCASAVAACMAGAQAEFNDCLGLEMSDMQSLPMCAPVYSACQVGVAKLNKELAVPASKALHPVSVISASESTSPNTSDTLFALLVQLAPKAASCPTDSLQTIGCGGFNMTLVEFYSILLSQDPSSTWSLEGYKRHNLSDNERAQIVAKYNAGEYFGSNLAIGIFDGDELPGAPEEHTGSVTRDLSRSPIVVFAVLGGVVLAIGLLLQQRRLQNGYTPIVKKVGGGQGKALDGSERSALQTSSSSTSLKGEVKTLKTEPTERFAV